MRKVRCISIRRSRPEQLKIGQTYYLDESTKWSDCDGDWYAVVYADNLKKIRVGVMAVTHFCFV